MALGVLRLSPSGPPVTNAEGGDAIPGPGMQLRLAEAAGSTTMAAFTASYQNIVDADGDPFEVELSAPVANLRYRFNFHCDVDEPTGNADAVQFRVVASYDDGATFTNVWAENSHALLANLERHCAIDVPITLGSALGATTPTPIPANTPNVKVRVQGKATTNGRAQIPNGGQSGTIWLSLAELL